MIIQGTNTSFEIVFYSSKKKIVFSKFKIYHISKN